MIEVLVVVAILGVLASVVIANVGSARDDAGRAAFITAGRSFADAALRLRLDTGAYPENSPAGNLPAGFENYITAQHWMQTTPLGGQWDSAYNQFGITSAVGVDFAGPGPEKDDAYMTEVDAVFDDGDLSTGVFQKLGNRRYYFIVAN